VKDYYHKHPNEYHEQTFHIDPTPFLTPLAYHLKPGDTILDIGCGSGRDLLWFKQRGFHVIGFERSSGLAELARENVGCEVFEGDFETHDFSDIHADAILLVGALVHVPHERVNDILQHVTNGLKEGGKVLITLKEGDGRYTDDQGRVSYLWKDTDLRKIFADLNFCILDFKKQISLVRESDTWLGYVLEKKVIENSD
jgi:SAM-dependent methyltransferase